MPYKPKKPCRYPGWTNLTDGTYCEVHQKIGVQTYDKYERSPDYKKKYGRAWKRISYKYAKAHPLCERCLKESRITPMEEVHHILPVNRGGTNAVENLMSVCRSCHNKIHIELGDRYPNER